MANSIEYKNIIKKYDDTTIIDNLSLGIETGEFVTIVGASGCGKTTLLKMTNGLISNDSGKIFINGKDIANENLINLRRNIGYAIQGSVLFPNMTVRQNIAYVPNLLNGRNKEKTRKAVDKWFSITHLDKSLLDRYPDELSGGEQQRVGIARSLAASPDILLMDEPFGAVDEITRAQLQQEILRIHKLAKITILFVTHDISEAMKLGTKVLILSKGNIAQYATPHEVLTNPANDAVTKLTATMH